MCAPQVSYSQCATLPPISDVMRAVALCKCCPTFVRLAETEGCELDGIREYFPVALHGLDHGLIECLRL